jgi:hypothetical protein
VKRRKRKVVSSIGDAIANVIQKVGAFVLYSVLVSNEEANAKRTLCCNVRMLDLWMHSKDCVFWQATMRKHRDHMKENDGKVPAEKFTAGDMSLSCPDCAYPLRHYGLYTVGEPCPHCGYVEKRVV